MGKETLRSIFAASAAFAGSMGGAYVDGHLSIPALWGAVGASVASAGAVLGFNAYPQKTQPVVDNQPEQGNPVNPITGDANIGPVE